MAQRGGIVKTDVDFPAGLWYTVRNFICDRLGEGTVSERPIFREKMAGENLHEGGGEGALEPRLERSSRRRRVLPVTVERGIDFFRTR